MTNPEIAELLRKVSAAYLILGENRFRIIAYDRAADSIEHLTSEVKDYWDDKKLEDIPGVGGGIASNLDELFRTGKSKHWVSVLGKVPEAIFPLLLVPGLGPKKAYALVKELNLTSAKTVIADLEKAAKAGRIAGMEGFGEKSQSVILEAIATYKRGAIKENRMPLPYADQIAREVMAHIQMGGNVEKINALGSLRRQVSTIGDIDIAVATNKPEEVLKHFLTFPHQKIIDRGPRGATMLLANGRQVDLRVQTPEAYGAMLQYFTGSKNHNIQLRSLALEKGLSLNEYGIKNVKTGKVKEYRTEEAFYEAVGLSYIPPELREDKGEIPAAKSGNLPDLVEAKDMRGDLHTHSSYDLQSSHDVGKNSIAELLTQADRLEYSYIGFSDHNPRANQPEAEIIEIMKKRRDAYDRAYEAWIQKNKSTLKFFLMCEVDILPDGRLALPEKAFTYVDAVIVSLHSAFTQERGQATKRLVTALTTNPKVRILGHPTGRLLGSREGVDADWQEVMSVAKKHDIALEINAYPDRLDLPDVLVYDAVKAGVKLSIDTDAHAAEHMLLMPYGVSVARRGWATKRDIVNCMDYNNFRTWLLKK
ncbi:PHP domain-containing protein [Candidatus Gottesmanbacteria bacterium]|nr:PHP domain-containing protein [Candidatus Gottesmanbacteria bacterium]